MSAEPDDLIRGSVLKYDAADDVNTDVIWPGKYTYVKMPPEEMATHAMETFDPEFPAKAARHQVLVVGRNFGCGSSREQAPQCLKYAGIQAVVAVSFARIFYRNAINLGLAVIECPDAVRKLRTGHTIELDLEGGMLTTSTGDGFEFAPYPPFVLELIRDGGLIEHIARQRASQDAGR
jgi:3-isopropylmalate/(R)-2-methylmalate dehydratase small subunit